ncbi:DUF309 domain-containing protein [Mesoterricola silvestris]|uniref:Uncharacterized protein n=1 Tax=Mesoterricola silvestris TaxID=2927979 RepID=A0AA48K8Y1_9BACT|nr:DUF309 domain-containing protein [Mesoterricola silvestris]BDU72575.1 hypothetical protein METEAL_17490 [Mesoterricola silvestris]
MTCGPRTPVFWQRQPGLPRPVLGFLRSRLEAALADPADRALLAWPTVLGAPRVREEFPGGLPEAELLARAAAMLPQEDPERAWRDVLARFPDTADRGPGGWVPHRIWDPLSSLVSLRSGVTLLALLGLPGGDRYPLAAGVSLFNAALFHECHDALEPLWLEAEGPLRGGLQGLILMAAGHHHLQVQNAPGMAGLLEDAVEALGGGDALATPWGTVSYGAALDLVRERLAALDDEFGERAEEPPWERLWALDRPEWELT